MTKYLNRCLNTLVGQTYKDIEIILVNDGSTDDSLSICQEYGANDKRIIIIDQVNSGVSAARNKGIEKATGEYILFVDPDDWVEFNMVDLLIENALSSNASVIIFTFKHHFSNKNKNKNKIQNIELKSNVYISKHKFIDSVYPLLINSDSLSSAFNKLYRRELLSGLCFDVSMDIGEDLYFNLSCFDKADSCYYINKSLYNYNRTDSESLSSKFRVDNFTSHITKLYRLRRTFSKKWSVSNLEPDNYVLGECYYELLNILSRGCKCGTKTEELFEFIEANPDILGLLFNINVYKSFKMKIIFMLLIYSPSLLIKFSGFIWKFKS
jgi:glycosyltransferase involved in cell wall biosynthesis